MTYSNLLFASVILPLSVLAILFDRSAEYKNLVLFLTSLLFVIWGRALAAALIFATVIIDFVLALAVGGSLEKRGKSSAAVFMIVDFLWNAFIFVLLTKNELFSADSTLHLRSALIPVGAAFYTLKNFSYVYDVYSGRIKAEKNFFCLLTYSASYPFLLAGPVVRYGDIEPQIRSRSVTAQKLNDGLTRFAYGFAKTVLVVPILERLSSEGLSQSEPTFIGAWLGMIAFFGAAYFTLMGLSDMGTGIARMNGFDVSLNYTSVTSKNMLSGLVKSYNTSMVEFFGDMRGEKGAAVMTFLLTILAAAFYADAKFIFAFAAIIGILLVAEQLIGSEKVEKIPSPIKFLVTLVIAMFLFSCFAFESFREWKAWVLHLLGKGNLYTLSKSVKYTVINNCWLLIGALISVSPIGVGICNMFKAAGEKSPKAYGRVRVLKTICTAILLISSYILLAARTI